MTREKLILGVGVSDVSSVARCKFYRVWHGILERCYSPKLHEKRPNYIGCSISNEWLHFSNFKSWMKKQDWQGKQLDKDILIQGNKLYSSDTCIFVDGSLNSLLTNRSNFRGEYPQGVCAIKTSVKYRSQCRANGRRQRRT